MKPYRVPFIFALYGFVMHLAFVIGSPVWFLGLLVHPERWKNRLGHVPVSPVLTGGDQRRIWVHASSVGEVRAATRVVEEMLREAGREVVFSTMTAAGNSVARASLGGIAGCFFMPLDVPFIVRRALARIKADALILVETEVWPSLILESKKRGMKVAIVNGKISDRGMCGYRRFEFLFKHVFGLIDSVAAQSSLYAEKYRCLGTPAERVLVTGNTKQDARAPSRASLGLRAKLGWNEGQILCVAGSTRPAEEEIVCAAFREAVSVSGMLRLIIAPRHLRRVSHVVRVAASMGLSVARWTAVRRGTEIAEGPGNAAGSRSQAVDVLVLDTIGDLMAVYRECNIAFVGGTLSGHGGHNILEPAAAGLALLAGPSTENIADDSRALAERGAMFRIKDSSQLAAELIRLAGSSGERERRGREALSFYEAKPMASVFTVESLRRAGVL